MNSYGETLKITIFGQSHGPAIGVVIDGFPAGFSIDMDALQRFLLARRAPGGAILRYAAQGGRSARVHRRACRR